MSDGTSPSIFITGAASGIGRATALHFVARGWYVGLYDIDEDGLFKLAQDIGLKYGPERCVSGRLDVRDRANWEIAMADFSEASGGRLDLLFNNAGIGAGGIFDEIPEEKARDMIDVNLRGVIHGVYAALPLLRRTAEQHGDARIVNTASMAGLYGLPGSAVYSGTKFAVRGLTEALNVEFAGDNILVSDIMPAAIDTNILNVTIEGSNRNARESFKEAGMVIHPPELAAKTVWAAAHGKKVHRTVGKEARMLRWLSHLVPGLARRQMSNNIKESMLSEQGDRS